MERAERGTSVTLHLKDTDLEFAEPLRLENLIRKYSDHIGFPVRLTKPGEEPATVNSATALWTLPRGDIKPEEYHEFYKHLSHDFADPLTWSHNRVEGKREYTSLLYVPAQAPFDLWNRDAPRGLKLYVQRVFIMDDAEQFLPLYLRFIKGIVDSADLPLNVSRELLQKNPELDAMKSALTRRALDMIGKLATDDSDEGRETYRQFWAEFGAVLKEGLIEDSGNSDKLMRLLRFATTRSDGAEQDQSLADYIGRLEEGQEKIYYLVADSHAKALSSPHLEKLKKSGTEVILFTDKIDPWVVENLHEFDGRSFQDAGRSDLELPAAEDESSEDADSDDTRALLEKIRKTLDERVEAVNLSHRLVDSAACVVTGEQDLPPQVRRMLEASGQALPDSKPVLEVNLRHPIIERLNAEDDAARFSELSNTVLDHALLAEGAQLDNPAEYVKRMNRLLLDIGA
jgi:molecular chaperone HtpG